MISLLDYSKTGMFSVRFTYYTEWEYQHGRKLARTNAPSLAEVNPLWAELWSLNIPAKVKSFCWRLLHGMLSCNNVLANHHIQTSSLCRFAKFTANISNMTFSFAQELLKYGNTWVFRLLLLQLAGWRTQALVLWNRSLEAKPSGIHA